jgi:hypothetical protein
MGLTDQPLDERHDALDKIAEWNLNNPLTMTVANNIAEASSILKTLRSNPDINKINDFFDCLDITIVLSSQLISTSNTTELLLELDKVRRATVSNVLMISNKPLKNRNLQYTIQYNIYQNIRDVFMKVMRELGRHNMGYTAHIRSSMHNKDKIKRAMERLE